MSSPPDADNKQSEAPRLNAYTGLIAWFTHNPVAANLLMAILIIGGAITAFTITKEIQPQVETNYVNITMPYLGATPTDVEQGVLIKIEEAIQDLEGISEIVSIASEGTGSVQVEVSPDYDIREVMDNIKMRVDSITTFPAETERPVYQRNVWSTEVIWVAVSSVDVDDRTLKEVARRVRDDITALPSVTKTELIGDRPYEIGIEVSEETLRNYGLTLTEVADAVGRSSLDLPGGRIQAAGGDILVRTVGQAYVGRDFEDIVVRTNPDGSRLLLRDIADIRDGFVEDNYYLTHNGRPAVGIRVLALGEQDALALSREVRGYVDRMQESLPDGVQVNWMIDVSYYLEGRLNMMSENLLMGAVLVFLILSLFLRLKLAFWVMAGLLTAFLGTLFTLPLFGITINLISLFAFLVVLGIVVDDAIIIGESAYTRIQRDGHSTNNVVLGVLDVAGPATFGVLTTMAAFLPILLVSGIWGQFFASIGGVVVICLFYSLIESKLILPAHLAHMRDAPAETLKPNRMIRFQRRFSDGLFRFVDNTYLPLLRRILRHRYLALAGALSVLILAVGLLVGGLLRVVFIPDLSGDFVQVELEMNKGTPAYVTQTNLDTIGQALTEVDQELQQELGLSEPLVRTQLAWTESDTSGGIMVELVKSENSLVSVPELSRRWREKVGRIPGARTFHIGGEGGPDDNDISLELVGQNQAHLEAASAELEQRLRDYNGVYDLRNSHDSGVREIQLRIRPEAELLGLSQRDLARQVRQAFYGEEVQRIQRGQDEVKVMVRYPRSERQSEGYLEDMRIRTGDSQAVPFSAVADLDMGSSPATIRRFNRQRSISITARVDKAVAEPGRITKDLIETQLPDILSHHPGVSYRVTGATREQEKMMVDLLYGTGLALFLIYALMAIPLKSYVQPLMIMSVIPFGTIGAAVGHLVLGMPFSLLSMFGIVALAGVVVNDSLILVDFVNRYRRDGEPLVEAAIKAARARFRPIILTSLTTFLGLVPIVFLEFSLQAQVVKPMAVSLSFGIVFATLITLVLIPTLYMVMDDVTGLFAGKRKNAEPESNENVA
ncbi:RND family efflux transporter [Alcanivorax xiamenensis]|uniref:RND family efflux transporter n=1 Tax=Alcanivorax xiamenensis TaxID=1177156 RepID=A0ABQ6YB56_9GAMM|nr:efflux RND transporter permease subunit [Alcanivorax xiamenensis]KAF0806927.1 RND family efflux transporter [Alcanivorax xiamenensis]